MQISAADIAHFEKRYRTTLINCLSGFKSLNLIGTKNAQGESNLALFSQVIHIGANPPLQGVLFRPTVVPRHTLENIYETREFTINQVHKSFYKKAHWTSARWDCSEFEGTGLTEEYLEGYSVPLVKESRIKSVLRFKERHLIQTNQTTLLVGEVKELIVDDQLIGPDGFLDLEAAETITVSGLDSYHSTNRLERLSYAKSEEPPEAIA